MEDLYLFDPMTEMEYIQIHTASVPYSFRMKLWDKTYEFLIRWNDIGGFYTLDLFDSNGAILAYGDPIRYGRPMFGTVEDERFPLPVIIPYAKRGSEVNEVTRENLGKDVMLFLFKRWV